MPEDESQRAEEPQEGQQPQRRAPRHEEPPRAAPRLDQQAQALSELLREALRPYQAELGAAVDRVVAKVPRERLVEAARLLRDDSTLRFDYLRCLATVDYQEYFELVYVLYSIPYRYHLLLKTTCTYQEPTVPTLIPIWPAADWHERESHDLYGVTFDGHPNLKPLLLYEGFEGYPGRRSFPFHEYEDW